MQRKKRHLGRNGADVRGYFVWILMTNLNGFMDINLDLDYTTLIEKHFIGPPSRPQHGIKISYKTILKYSKLDQHIHKDSFTK